MLIKVEIKMGLWCINECLCCKPSELILLLIQPFLGQWTNNREFQEKLDHLKCINMEVKLWVISTWDPDLLCSQGNKITSWRPTLLNRIIIVTHRVSTLKKSKCKSKVMALTKMERCMHHLLNTKARSYSPKVSNF
jgi:hypothetical protein